MLEKAINPFTAGLTVKYTEVIKTASGYGIDANKEVYNIELEPAIRVYNCVSNRKYIFQTLSVYARDLLLAMYYFVNHETPYVILTHEKVLELYGTYSKRRYEDTVRELIKNVIIDCKDRSRNQYWYNPVFFSSGSRLKMYPECGLKMNTIYRGIDNKQE